MNTDGTLIEKNEMEKIPCKTCGTLILSTTAQDNNGNCMLCYKKEKNKKLIDSRQVEKPNFKLEDIDIYFQDDDHRKICGRLSEFLAQFYEEVSDEDLPVLYQIIDSITEFVAEYNSSGLFGYLDHCSGANAEDFKKAIRIIEANEFINIMDSVSLFFPGAVIPIDDEMRSDTLWSEGVEGKINELESNLKPEGHLAAEHLFTSLITYLSSRKKELLEETNTCGQIVKYNSEHAI